MIGKIALRMALPLVASVCYADDSVQLELWRNDGRNVSYQGKIVLPCRSGKDGQGTICSSEVPPEQESGGLARDFYWVSLRGSTIGYWIRFQGSQIVEIGADANAFAVRGNSATGAESPRHFSITLPPRR